MELIKGRDIVFVSDWRAKQEKKSLEKLSRTFEGVYEKKKAFKY